VLPDLFATVRATREPFLMRLRCAKKSRAGARLSLRFL
jgi:hypothetical protein